jgi:hypothetical protein
MSFLKIKLAKIYTYTSTSTSKQANIKVSTSYLSCRNKAKNKSILIKNKLNIYNRLYTQANIKFRPCLS